MIQGLRLCCFHTNFEISSQPRTLHLTKVQCGFVCRYGSRTVELLRRYYQGQLSGISTADGDASGDEAAEAGLPNGNSHQERINSNGEASVGKLASQNFLNLQVMQVMTWHTLRPREQIAGEQFVFQDRAPAAADMSSRCVPASLDSLECASWDCNICPPPPLPAAPAGAQMVRSSSSLCTVRFYSRFCICSANTLAALKCFIA